VFVHDEEAMKMMTFLPPLHVDDVDNEVEVALVLAV
jgi:hypothetical protein